MTSDRLASTFAKTGPLLSIYITAGFPVLESTVPLCQMLETAGVDMIEIGFPFSDPIADGPVIQQSSAQALKNGMTLEVLFRQLDKIRSQVSIPLLLMGYLNPVMQFGREKFCNAARTTGIDGLILPDTPTDWLQGEFGRHLEENRLSLIPLVTPLTSDERLKKLDALASSFIYAVSTTAVTGATLDIQKVRHGYLERLAGLVKHPVMVGFGIDSAAAFKGITESAKGAIIGSAFIKSLQSGGNYIESGRSFVESIRGAT